MKIFRLLPIVVAIFIISTTDAEELSSIEVESSILSNSITENRYPVAIIDSTDIDPSKSIGTNLEVFLEYLTLTTVPLSVNQS